MTPDTTIGAVFSVYSFNILCGFLRMRYVTDIKFDSTEKPRSKLIGIRRK